jgi:hypothetical protein
LPKSITTLSPDELIYPAPAPAPLFCGDQELSIIFKADKEICEASSVMGWSDRGVEELVAAGTAAPRSISIKIAPIKNVLDNNFPLST